MLKVIVRHSRKLASFLTTLHRAPSNPFTSAVVR